MLENFLNNALEVEMEDHLAKNKDNGGKDRRNGKMKKVQAKKFPNPIDVETPVTGTDHFEPKL